MNTESSDYEDDAVEPEFCEHGVDFNGTGPTCSRCEEPTKNERVESCSHCSTSFARCQQKYRDSDNHCCSKCSHPVTYTGPRATLAAPSAREQGIRNGTIFDPYRRHLYRR